MAQSYCRYDCAHTPGTISSEPDITGVGISLAYTITAGLALCVVVAYYVFAYRPDVDPYIQPGHTSSANIGLNFKTNPIDDYLLFWRLKRVVSKQKPFAKNDSVKDAFMHCMLIMSDIQLITGLSILISGFSQLRCGISVFHWQRIVHLAWFSSVTHMCCLTFLREYFLQKKVACWWRLSGMVFLVIMLIVALAPTANWGRVTKTLRLSELETLSEGVNPRPYPQDYAICSFRPDTRNEMSQYHEFYTDLMSAARDRVVLSAVLLGLGMVNRIMQAYPLPKQLYHRVRTWIGDRLKCLLQRVFSWSWSRSPLSCISSVLLYRPALAIFLTTRLLLDIATSKAFDILWISISFTWGVLSLWHDQLVDEPGSQQWTFGQVIALVLLVAPMIALIEGFTTKISFGLLHQQESNGPRVDQEENDNAQEDILMLPKPVTNATCSRHSPRISTSSRLLARDDIQRDFYKQSWSFPMLVYAVILWMVGLGVAVLGWVRFAELSPMAILNPFDFQEGMSTPFSIVISIIICVLLSLVIVVPSPSSLVLHNVAKVFILLMYLVIMLLLPFALFRKFRVYVVSACFSLYGLLSLIDIYRKWRLQ